MNILIVKLSAIGDVVLALPFLESLRRAFPRARITWLVEEAAAGLLPPPPLLDRVLVARRKTWLRELAAGRPWRAARDVGGFIRELRRERYDVVVDLQGLLKSGVWVGLSRGKRKIGFDRTRELSYLFLGERLPRYDPERHALLRYLDAAVYLGGAAEPVMFRFPERPEAAREAEKLLAGLSRPLVAVNPGAKWPSKLWPEAHWRELIRRLAGDLGLGVVLTGSPDERAANGRLALGPDPAADLTGRTSLPVLAEVFRRVDLVVGPDTGPMHLAAATGTPVIALFGPTAPWRTGPFGPGSLALRTGIECSPCFRKSCPRPRCLTDLTPDTVARAVGRFLEGPGRRDGRPVPIHAATVSDQAHPTTRKA
ncbi:MAG: glycosyltransferase family 9 protein [Pseudomonadota bacterium]